MISEDFDFQKFVNAVREKEAAEVVSIAEQEATEAWMRSYRKALEMGPLMRQSHSYQKKLLALIDYMRHGIWPNSFEDQELKILNEARLNEARSMRAN